MTSNFKEIMPQFEEVIVKSEFNSDNTFRPENEHPVGNSIAAMDYDYSSIKIKKEYESIDTNELNTDSLKQVDANFKCKEEINDEEHSGISNIFVFIQEKQEYVEEFFENSGTDEKLDISNNTTESSEHNEEDSKDQKAFTQGKQLITTTIHTCNICNSYETTDISKLDWHINSVHNELRNKIKCQFCTESFTGKQSLDGHVLRMHRDMIKDDIKSFITSKIHVCKICNSYETTKKWTLDRHINSAHNEVKVTMKCQFCTESFLIKRSLDGHVLRKHKDKIKNNISKVITSKFHACKICNYETTNKSDFDRHINSTHNEVKIKVKCQFCTEVFMRKQSLDGHILRKHKDIIKNDIKSYITSKIYVCKICNSYETTHISRLDSHINSVHNKAKVKMMCQFCPESFTGKQSLEGHVLRMHRDKIKNDIQSFITSKIHLCKICNSFETTKKWALDRHMKSVHKEVKIEME